MQSNLRVDDLNLDGLKLFQEPNGYGFTSDSVLLANYVRAKHKDKCVEIGTGSGIISILVNYKEKPDKIFAFEIQEKVACLAKKNVELNNMQNQIDIISDAVQNFKKYIECGCADVVFCNPPYFKFDQTVSGENEEKIVSRFDRELSLEDLFLCASKMLKFGGKMFFVMCSERMAECFSVMEKNNIVPKRIYFAHPNEKKDASVFLCEGVKGAKMGLKIMPPLFTNNLNGDYVQTIQKLYK